MSLCSPTLLRRPPELCQPSDEDEELPLLDLLLPTLSEELPRLPELLPIDPLVPLRRLGSFSGFSLRPMF